MPEGAKFAAHQPRVTHVTGADNGIETFFDHVNQAVGEIEVQGDFGVSLHERRYRRHQQHSCQRKTHAQEAMGLAAGP